LIYSNTSFFI